MKRVQIISSISGFIMAFFVGKKVVDTVKDHHTSNKNPGSKSWVDSPRKLSIPQWKRALLETKDALSNKNLGILAAGVAFFSTFAFFPLMAASVAIAAFVIEPHQLQNIFAGLESFLPKDIASLIQTQLANSSGKHASNIILAVVAILISLYSASSAIQNLIQATNEAYDVQESRGFIKMKLLSLAITVGGLIGLFILVPLLLVTPDFLTDIGVPSVIAGLIIYVRWLFVLVAITIALALFYRYGPNRTNPRWQWVSWGAGIATAIWLIATALFFFYAQNFAKFSGSYGVFAGILVMMTWLNITALIFLIGAQVNHRLETKTRQPTKA